MVTLRSQCRGSVAGSFLFTVWVCVEISRLSDNSIYVFSLHLHALSEITTPFTRRNDLHFRYAIPFFGIPQSITIQSLLDHELPLRTNFLYNVHFSTALSVPLEEGLLGAEQREISGTSATENIPQTKTAFGAP